MLDTKGITSTSANYLCNLAKELIKEINFSELSFVQHSVELINGEKKLIRKANSPISLQNLLERQGNLIAFCSYMREAIKEKDRLLDEIDNLTLREWTELPCLVTKSLVTEKEVFDVRWNIKEKEHYWHIEALASTFGKYIHPEGIISNARNEMIKRMQKPCEITGNGRDTIINTYEVLNSSEINNTYIALQSKQREYEKELNQLKHRLKNQTLELNKQINLENQKQLSEYNKIYTEKENEFEKYVLEKRKEISDLKIVIPEALKETYEYLNNL